MVVKNLNKAKRIEKRVNFLFDGKSKMRWPKGKAKATTRIGASVTPTDNGNEGSCRKSINLVVKVTPKGLQVLNGYDYNNSMSERKT